MLRKGDMVKILPEFQDEGDSEYEWVVVGDEEKGRVDISPASINMRQKPITFSIVMTSGMEPCARRANW